MGFLRRTIYRIRPSVSLLRLVRFAAFRPDLIIPVAVSAWPEHRISFIPECVNFRPDWVPAGTIQPRFAAVIDVNYFEFAAQHPPSPSKSHRQSRSAAVRAGTIFMTGQRRKCTGRRTGRRARSASACPASLMRVPSSNQQFNLTLLQRPILTLKSPSGAGESPDRQ